MLEKGEFDMSNVEEKMKENIDQGEMTDAELDSVVGGVGAYTIEEEYSILGLERVATREYLLKVSSGHMSNMVRLHDYGYKKDGMVISEKAADALVFYSHQGGNVGTLTKELLQTALDFKAQAGADAFKKDVANSNL